MLETAERLVTEEGEPAVQQFLLLVGGLRAMAARRAPGQAGPRLLPAALAVGRGLRPVVRPLRRSAAIEGPHRFFNPSAGGVLCAVRPAARARRPRPRRRWSLLGALLVGDWPVVHAADPRHLREASSLVSAYLAWHLERGLRSMEYVER